MTADSTGSSTGGIASDGTAGAVPEAPASPGSPDELAGLLEGTGYLADPGIA
ncbi:MoxR family ATPase, partial [Klebsiella pneumoniae]